MPKWWGHLKTINHHKMLVMKYCFQIGLYKQGLLHDLSKYSWVEFRAGAKYFQGDRSPNDAQRKALGYSDAWLHHKGRNKHHLEYWIDYAADGDHKMSGNKMPFCYVAEMFCDRVAASKNYQKERYQDCHPWEYYDRSKDHYLIHAETQALLESFLLLLKEQGEEKAFAVLKEEVKHRKRTKTFYQ